MSDNIIWYTRCPVPTAAGLARQLHAFEEMFQGGYEVRNIKQLGKTQSNTHFKHNLPSSFREGGGSPPVWAYANGADTKLLGIGFVEEKLGIYVRADDPATGMEGLAGRRVALPDWPKLIFNFFHFAAEKAFYSALRVHGMTMRDVKVVEVVEDQDPADIVNPDYADTNQRTAKTFYYNQLQALLNGEVDAIFGKGGEAAVLEREGGDKIRLLYDVRTSPEITDRVNNYTPRLLTGSANLLREDPEAVTKYVQTLVRSAKWAVSHEDQAAELIAREAGFDKQDIGKSFEPHCPTKLMLGTSDWLISMVDVMKSFLFERGYIPRNFDTREWLDPRPLAEACAREGVTPADSAAHRVAAE
jgi:ABC-type nitrate/sulfonate/bicarbonate transport system substrate-binding protein